MREITTRIQIYVNDIIIVMELYHIEIKAYFRIEWSILLHVICSVEYNIAIYIYQRGHFLCHITFSSYGIIYQARNILRNLHILSTKYF